MFQIVLPGFIPLSGLLAVEVGSVVEIFHETFQIGFTDLRHGDEVLGFIESLKAYRTEVFRRLDEAVTATGECLCPRFIKYHL